VQPAQPCPAPSCSAAPSSSATAWPPAWLTAWCTWAWTL